VPTSPFAPPGARELGLVTVVAQLALTESDFDAAAQASYKTNLATAAGNGVTASDITLTIAASSITVTAEIRTASRVVAAAAAAAISNEIQVTATSGSFMGVTVAATPAPPTTSVLVIPAPSTPPPTSPAPSPPVPSPPSPLQPSVGVPGSAITGSSDSTGPIIGGVIGGLAAPLLAVLGYILYKRSKEKNMGEASVVHAGAMPPMSSASSAAAGAFGESSVIEDVSFSPQMETAKI